MAEDSLQPGTLQASGVDFEEKKTRLIIQVLVISTIVIFTIETFLMVFLEFYLVLPEPLVMVLDGLVLVVFLFPINFVFIVRPMLHQIDEHHRTNLELVKTNEVLERFFSISDILIAYLDTNFNFIRVNQAYAKTDERSPADFIGKNHFDLFPNGENRAIFEGVVKTGLPYYAIEKPFEYASNLERGVTYWDWSLLPVKNPEGLVIALILVLNNVTDRKRAQLALAESERRFRAVFNQTFQHIGLLDPHGNVLIANQSALDFTGIETKDVVGKPLWLVPWWDTKLDSTCLLQSIVEQAAGGTVVRCENRVKCADGSLASMDITIKPLSDENGKTMMLIYEARDITTRIRSEEALKHREAEIKRLYQAEMRAHEFAETLRSAVLAQSGSLDSGKVIESLLDHLYKVIPYTSAHVILLEDEDHLVVRMARGEENWEPPQRLFGKRFDTSDLLFLEPLLSEGRMISNPDTLLFHQNFSLPSDEFVRCWIAIPLQAGELIIGACLLEHTCPSFFTDDLVHWATALTGQASVAIQNAWLFEQVRDNRERLQALSRRLVEVQESERNYVARELHDEAGQALASLMVGLRLIERDSNDPAAVVARSKELKEITDEVLENLHRLAIDLRPATLDHLGLVAALRQHTELISDKHGLTVQFETVGRIERLPGETETAIYRIVQEALTNVIRHAHATRVDILLERRAEILIVVVEDNGVGFDQQVPRVNQLGMEGMRERAEMLGGAITVETAPGKGTTIFLEVPCQSES